MTRRPNVRTPPTILIMYSIIPTLVSLPKDSKGRKSAKLLSKAFNQSAISCLSETYNMRK